MPAEHVAVTRLDHTPDHEVDCNDVTDDGVDVSRPTVPSHFSELWLQDKGADGADLKRCSDLGLATLPKPWYWRLAECSVLKLQ